jgi:hypothetical protein
MKHHKITVLKTEEEKFKGQGVFDPTNAEYFNGWKVSKEMFDYLNALTKAMPKTKFAPYNTEWINGGFERQICKFAVYMDEFPYALGFVGHGIFSVKGGSRAYMIESRKIKNTKYSPSRDQYYMQMTTDFKKAIKNASTYLVPFSIKELAHFTYRAFSRNVEKVKDDVDGLHHKITRPIRDKTSVVIAEMKNLMAQNVTFVTQEFQDLAKIFVDTLAEQEEERKRHVFGVYVRIRNIGTDTYADIYKVYDVKNNLYGIKDNGSPSTTTLVADLDPEIAGNIAVLNMLQDEQYVPRVGYKVDETTFWLERV